jgi:hypothetical protein
VLAEQGQIRPLIGAGVPFGIAAETPRIMARREAIGNIVVDLRPAVHTPHVHVSSTPPSTGRVTPVM